MVYRLVLSEPTDETTKDVGENVLLANLSFDYKVYLFYYPGALPNEDLEKKLRALGAASGKNLFVNIGKLDDPDYDKIAARFGIRNLPVVVVTGVAALASPPSEPATLYVKLDSKALLNSPDSTIQCVETLFNLFMAGKVVEAAKQSKRDQLLAVVKEVILTPLKGIVSFISERDIVVSVMKGTLELKKSGK